MISTAALPERDALIVLAGSASIGPATLATAIERAGGAARLLELARRTDDGRALRSVLGRDAPDPDASQAMAAGRRLHDLGIVFEGVRTAAVAGERFLEELRGAGLEPVTILDEGYPARLRAIADPPPVLFVRGDVRVLAAPSAVAVVGTRHPTEAGRRVAARLAGALARAGGVVVSGLAIGVDGAAHAAAIAEAAPTIAVLGGGHARLFPRAHARLADAIAAEGGAVISEWGPGTEPARWSFPRRNRLVSGLSDATVVVEAGVRSGALITAAWALEQGRACFVVPGAIDAPASRGCLALLRELPDAVRVVAGVAELVEDLGLAGAGRTAPDGSEAAPSGGPRRDATLATLGRVEAAVATALAAGSTTVDELVGMTGEPVPVVLATLTLLEVRGLAVEAYGRYRPAGRLASSAAPRPRRVRLGIGPGRAVARGPTGGPPSG